MQFYTKKCYIASVLSFFFSFIFSPTCTHSAPYLLSRGLTGGLKDQEWKQYLVRLFAQERDKQCILHRLAHPIKALLVYITGS